MSSSFCAAAPAADHSSEKPIIRNEDMLAVKRYITAYDSDPRRGLGETTILVDLTHSNLVQRHIEIRFDKHDLLLDAKKKIHQKTGTPPHFQTLRIKCSGEILWEIHAENESMDQYKLGYFFPDQLLSGGGLEIHCIDVNPLSGSRNGLYEDVSLVEKYRISEEDYNKRKGTLRDWARSKKEKDSTFTLAKHAKEHRERVEAMRQFKQGIFPLPYGYVVDSTGKDIVKEVDDDEDTAVVAVNAKSKTIPSKWDASTVTNIKVGNRCQVQPGSRRGVVSFVGCVPELDNQESSYWVGVTFDEPVGKTDGTAIGKKGQSRRYFDALEGYASFVRGSKVEVGDFPEIDLFADDSDDEDEL